MRIQAFAIVLALGWAAIGGARAATEVQFTITNTSGTTLATFELPLNPMVNGTFAPGFSFDVPAVVNGSPTTLVFLSKELGGGGFLADPLFTFSGPQFYTGPESSPTFVTDGVYPVTNTATLEMDRVKVRELPDPPDDPRALSVPELSTWVMLLLGFVGLSYAGYRKARTSTTLAA